MLFPRIILIFLSCTLFSPRFCCPKNRSDPSMIERVRGDWIEANSISKYFSPKRGFESQKFPRLKSQIKTVEEIWVLRNKNKLVNINWFPGIKLFYEPVHQELIAPTSLHQEMICVEPVQQNLDFQKPVNRNAVSHEVIHQQSISVGRFRSIKGDVFWAVLSIVECRGVAEKGKGISG